MMRAFSGTIWTPMIITRNALRPRNPNRAVATAARHGLAAPLRARSRDLRLSHGLPDVEERDDDQDQDQQNRDRRADAVLRDPERLPVRVDRDRVVVGARTLVEEDVDLVEDAEVPDRG